MRLVIMLVALLSGVAHADFSSREPLDVYDLKTGKKIGKSRQVHGNFKKESMVGSGAPENMATSVDGKTVRQELVTGKDRRPRY